MISIWSGYYQLINNNRHDFCFEPTLHVSGKLHNAKFQNNRDHRTIRTTLISLNQNIVFMDR